MSTQNYAVWIWKDKAKCVRYVGYGPYSREHGHPASKKWAERDVDNSDLHLWLQELTEEPLREQCGPAITTRATAYTLATSYRRRYSDTLLASRGSMTIKGGGNPKPVLHVPEDDCTQAELYDSVRKAADATGIAGSTITRRCQNATNQEWLFADEF